MAKRKSKTPRQKAVLHADNWFSKYIRERDGASVLSGDTEKLNCGHVFSRAHYATRWDDFNAFAQTAGENLKHEHDAYPYWLWFKQTFGEWAFDELHRKWNTTRKFTTEEIREIGDYYKKKYEYLLSPHFECDTIPVPVADLSSMPEGVW